MRTECELHLTSKKVTSIYVITLSGYMNVPEAYYPNAKAPTNDYSCVALELITIRIIIKTLIHE